MTKTVVQDKQQNPTNTKKLDLSSSQTYTSNQIVDYLKVNPSFGLTKDQVTSNRTTFGTNEIKQKKKTNIFLRFLKQFKDPMILILLAAAAISFVALIFEKHKEAADWAEPFIILFITFVNACIGAYQEAKADKAVESLKQLTANTTKVVRNGEILVLPTNCVVVGDILFLESGDNVYADARILDANNLKVVESSLTGEFVPVEKNEKKLWNKDTPLGDRSNMLYSGTTIVNGSVTAVVTSVGMNTEIGKIATMIQEVKPEKTPLQKQIAKFTKVITIVCIIICFIALGIEFIQVGLDHAWKDADHIIEAIMVAVSLAVAAVPEGLPIVITVNMATGMQRMAKENAIVKNLASVEVLGSTSVICTDKTGTLTQNKMTINRMYDFKDDELLFMNQPFNGHQKWILSLGTLCSNASITFKKNKEVKSQGDPTELAIIRACILTQHDNELLKEKQKDKVEEFPFDSERKLMTVIYKYEGKYIVITKGANEMLLKKCKLSPKQKGKITRLANSLASQGERTLGIAYKTLRKLPKKLTSSVIEKDLTYLGMLGMIDPPRETAKSSIKECKAAGIKVVMITGDHILTATNIARNLGIYNNDQDLAITGEELEKMSDAEFNKKLPHIVVYARVAPKDKLRIANAWKASNNVVAMIGDGVNDAPALKAANIGCAMGNSTDVSKDASDMILQDNNFQTIVHAVKQGRTIFANILKVINYLVATNLAEVIIIISLIITDLCIDWGEVITFSSLQILWINLLGDSLPAITLGQEPSEKDIMTHPPRNVKDSIFGNGLWKRILGEAIVHSIIGLAGFFMCFYIAKDLGFDTYHRTGFGWYQDANEVHVRAGSTGLFLILGVSQMVQVLNLKSDESFFKTHFGDNKQLLVCTLVSTLLIFLVVFVPDIAETFNMVLFYWNGTMGLCYLYCLLIAVIVPIVYMEITKAIHRRINRSKTPRTPDNRDQAEAKPIVKDPSIKIVVKSN